jgi:hypothetical protein
MEFARLVVKHRAERAAKGFTCWTQFVAMLFCQMARADSLREICHGLSSCLGKLVHLGVGEAPNKSTLGYANKHRPAALYEDLFWTALERFRGQGALGARRHKLENANYRVVKRRKVPRRGNVLRDEIIRLTGVGAAEKCPYDLRRIVVWDERNQREIVLLTNHLEFGATMIAAIYKDRWQIELFFKALKQNRKIKTFVGTSENALRIQIWTALIALLLLKWLHHLSKAGWSLSNLAAMLRLNLFTYRDLIEWIHNPFGSPPIVPDGPEQLLFSFADSGQPNSVRG